LTNGSVDLDAAFFGAQRRADTALCPLVHRMIPTGICRIGAQEAR